MQKKSKIFFYLICIENLKNKYIQIKNFLKEDVNVDDIPIIDESTSNRV